MCLHDPEVSAKVAGTPSDADGTAHLPESVTLHHPAVMRECEVRVKRKRQGEEDDEARGLLLARQEAAVRAAKQRSISAGMVLSLLSSAVSRLRLAPYSPVSLPPPCTGRAKEDVTCFRCGHKGHFPCKCTATLTVKGRSCVKLGSDAHRPNMLFSSINKKILL